MGKRVNGGDPGTGDPRTGEWGTGEWGTGAWESPYQNDPRVAFAIRLSKALHRYGTPTHRLEQTMSMVLRRMGLRGMFFSIPTGIFASFGFPEEHKTSLVRTSLSEVNLEKLSDLDELSAGVIDGHIGAEEGMKRIESIVAAPPRYSRLTITLSFALSSAASSRFFGGGWREVVVAAIIGIVIGGIAIVVGRREGTRRLFEISAAVAAAAIAAVATQWISLSSVYIATLGGLIILLPGLTLATAMTELATGNLVSGTARLTGAALTFLEIGFGVALGGEISRLLPDVATMTRHVPLPEWTLFLALAVAPLSFAVLLCARLRDVGWITLACLVSFGSARLGTFLLGPQLGAFVGATALGLAGNLFSRFIRRPTAVLLLPGLILLVPGSIGFGSLAKFIERDVMSGVGAAFNVALVATALVTGLLLANVIVPSKRGL